MGSLLLKNNSYKKLCLHSWGKTFFVLSIEYTNTKQCKKAMKNSKKGEKVFVAIEDSWNAFRAKLLNSWAKLISGTYTRKADYAWPDFPVWPELSIQIPPSLATLNQIHFVHTCFCAFSESEVDFKLEYTKSDTA